MKRMLLVRDHAIFTQAMRIVGGMGVSGTVGTLAQGREPGSRGGGPNVARW
ncbi:MAG: hypothetical protein WKF28_10355 [Rubrobacteraceae bacterium]